MSHTIRSAAVTAARPDRRGRRGQGHDDGAGAQTGAATATALLRRRATPTASRGAAARAASSTASRPAIIEPIAVQDVAQPPDRAAGDALREPTRRGMRGFGADHAAAAGDAVSLADLGPGEVYLNAQGGRDARRSRRRRRARPRRARGAAPLRVKAIVRYDGAGTRRRRAC